MTSKSKYKI